MLTISARMLQRKKTRTTHKSIIARPCRQLSIIFCIRKGITSVILARKKNISATIQQKWIPKKGIRNVFGLIHLKGYIKDGDVSVHHMLQNMLERLAYFFSHSCGANSICMNLYFCPEYLGDSPISLFWLRERELRIAVAFLISLEHHTHVQQCKGKEM